MNKTLIVAVSAMLACLLVGCTPAAPDPSDSGGTPATQPATQPASPTVSQQPGGTVQNEKAPVTTQGVPR